MADAESSMTLTWPAHLSHLAVSHSEFLRRHSSVQQIAAGALVFQGDRLLLVQRSASEKAFPHRWEFPGGSVDDTDSTILHAAARELLEETGFLATAITHQVGAGVYFATGRAKWLKLSFIVIVRGHIPVKLDPIEHQNFLWATEEEIRRGEVGGLHLDFVSPDQVAVMLEGFRIIRSGAGR
ncbi:hypothetical protein K490DRAFT_31235 [Saccharata proteae CBS 121410]|uniref:Nudix hydrolase domain-containing protein n=1 Tax=Saccharata proteae CBS 121410 TaxID=1314787 RepID=A0A9P4I429_9PEZI|nr:hypothetical protein K490DRAFT_31235 [Saccharata proteae CBS 121410]